MSAPKNRPAQPRHILATEAAKLRAQGLVGRQIAERLHVSQSYAYELLEDPTGELNRERKKKYNGTCESCGAPASYGHSGLARCRVCYEDDIKIWTQDAIVCAIQEWADEHGGIPPSAMDWNPQMAISHGRPEKAEKFYADGHWPNVKSAQEQFGSWNAAIAAAGLEPRRIGCYGRPGEFLTDSDRLRIAEMYVEGISASAVAAEFGISPRTVTRTLAKMGVPLRSHSEAARLRWARQQAAA
jgi:DNA-binding CsgD family transcriptional regulator